MRPIRYVGRHRNAGYGYSLIERCRREVAYWLRDRGFVKLGYLVDFERDRYLDEYLDQVEELDGDRGVWGDSSPQ